jgi:hypothetical protein
MRFLSTLSLAVLGSVLSCDAPPDAPSTLLASTSQRLTGCNPLSNPYDACTVADANGVVTRAALQSLVDKARHQYDARVASNLGAAAYVAPIEIHLSEDLTYTLDGPLVVGPGIHLAGNASARPRLISAGERLQVADWAAQARALASSFHYASGPVTFHEATRTLRCTASSGCAPALKTALLQLEKHVQSSYCLLSPDGAAACAGGSFRYFDLMNYASVWLASGNAGLLGGISSGEGGTNTIPDNTEILIPAFELADEVGSLSRSAADPVIRIDATALTGSGDADTARMQVAVDDVAIACAMGPYYPVARTGTSGAGYGAAGIQVWPGGDGTIGIDVNDVQIRNSEISHCFAPIYTYNGRNVTLTGNTLATGVRPAASPTFEFEGLSYKRGSTFAVAPEYRGEGANGIRVHGTRDRGYRIAGNTIGRAVPGGAAEGPARGIHIHGSTYVNGATTRSDFVVIDNTVLWAQEAGIHVQGRQDRVRVAQNTFGGVGPIYPAAKALEWVAVVAEVGLGDYCGLPIYPTNWTVSDVVDTSSHFASNYVCPDPRYAYVRGTKTWRSMPTIDAPQGCAGADMPLVLYPAPHPSSESGAPEVEVGRVLRFAPPPPSFTAGCPADVAPVYEVRVMTPGSGWTPVKSYGTGPAEWTAPAPGSYTFELRMRSAESGADYEVKTSTRTVNVVAHLTEASTHCDPSRVAFEPVDGLVRVAPQVPIACDDKSPLEYKVYVRRSGDTGRWSVLRDWGAESETYWKPEAQPHDFQIWYRHQGSNAAYEGASRVCSYP